MSVRTRVDLRGYVRAYSRMEAANVFIVPATMLLLSGGRLGWFSLLPLVSVALLLGIGALYWRAKVRELDTGLVSTSLLTLIAGFQYPMLCLVFLSTLSATGAWIYQDMTRGLADRWVATGSAILGILEYVNYYHRQLQHFDNRRDLMRFLSGRRFPVSHLAKDLRKLKNS